ncbi:alpha-2 adrenergic receptor [Trichonephila clavipes]|nr:alpha-2 adrenergic receptor [Trichonephila clavipes]
MKIGNNGNLVLGPFDESTPCLMIVLMNCQTKLKINHLTSVKSVAILEIENDNVYTIPINADKDILEFIKSSKNIIDSDSEDENEKNDTAPVQTSSEMRNRMKNYHGLKVRLCYQSIFGDECLHKAFQVSLDEKQCFVLCGVKPQDLEANSQLQSVKLGGHQTCLSINRLWQHELCDMLRRLVGTTAPGHHDCSIQE